VVPMRIIARSILVATGLLFAAVTANAQGYYSGYYYPGYTTYPGYTAYPSYTYPYPIIITTCIRHMPVRITIRGRRLTTTRTSPCVPIPTAPDLRPIDPLFMRYRLGGGPI